MDTDRIKKKFENMSNEELTFFSESYDPSDFLPEARKIIEEIISERNKELGNYQKPKSELEEKENKLKGLGGWLILVGIGLVISPLRLLVESASTFLPIFRNGSWKAITTVGSEAYNLPLAFFIAGEIIYNIAMFLLLIYLINLFIKKHYLFPKFYIIMFLLSITLRLLDAWLGSQFFPNEPIFDPKTAAGFLRTIIIGLIWIPYMLKSKRVKATFIEKLPITQIKPITKSEG